MKPPTNSYASSAHNLSFPSTWVLMIRVGMCVNVNYVCTMYIHTFVGSGAYSIQCLLKANPEIRDESYGCNRDDTLRSACARLLLRAWGCYVVAIMQVTIQIYKVPTTHLSV